MKAIIIVDEMPECCYDCNFCKFNGGYNKGYFGRDCLLTGEEVQRDFDITKLRHKSCPLKPLPETLDANDWHRMFSGSYGERRAKGYGYNACLNEILGEEE